MLEHEFVHFALENLQKTAGIKGKWMKNGPKNRDGKIELIVDNQHLKFNVEIKRELRNHQLAKIFQQADEVGSFMIIASNIFPKIKEELRKNNVAYLETNGNIWLRQEGIMIWLEGQKPAMEIRNKSNRAFTKTGLKVLFHFLLHEDDVNLNYREIADITGVALGNISYVMNGLKEMGFLIKLNKDNYKLINKKALLGKWITGFHETLKPTIGTGTFRFLKMEEFVNWKNIELNKEKTLWGGEPAGDLLTNYLRPAELTLYTLETRNELIKNYKLIPDVNGNVKAFQKFWQQAEEKDNTVPPLLVYADLINTNDRRCIETAQKIYDEFLQNKF